MEKDPIVQGTKDSGFHGLQTWEPQHHIRGTTTSCSGNQVNELF